MFKIISYVNINLNYFLARLSRFVILRSKFHIKLLSTNIIILSYKYKKNPWIIFISKWRFWSGNLKLTDNNETSWEMRVSQLSMISSHLKLRCDKFKLKRSRICTGDANTTALNALSQFSSCIANNAELFCHTPHKIQNMFRIPFPAACEVAPLCIMTTLRAMELRDYVHALQRICILNWRVRSEDTARERSNYT